MSNRLADESSPYLRQHADNPVDWYPWGDEALAKAKAEDKPIFLSIGYSACHWCHVMAHESFENERTAALLNRHFVNVKVDREERPDLDHIYMSAVQALTGRGGWPMSVFLTPEGLPFYGGTYFPPVRLYGMTSFTDVITAVVEAWRDRRYEVTKSARELATAIRRQQALPEAGAHDDQLDESVLAAAVDQLRDGFDHAHGGWGGAPKFPQPMAIEFLLRRHHSTGDHGLLTMASRSLEAMVRGGIYDQLGGGFHRYSVDDRWLIPHFEKMLYDNAQLARVYLHAWQVTGIELFRRVAEETLDYVVREMTDAAGGFYATQDADSEGEEGKFFVWTPDEIQGVLGDDAQAFMAAYGVTNEGNFEGKNVLAFVGTFDQRAQLENARQMLFEAREKRVHPGRDDKILTSWNGLMLAGFAEAARVVGRDDFRQVAERNAAFLLRELRQADGRLMHTWKDGQAQVDGYLEDYSYLIEGLVELYQTTFDDRWYQAAYELGQGMIDRFAAPDGGFYDTSADHGSPIARPRDIQDNATPSGSAMAATVLQPLASLAVHLPYRERARRMLAQVQPLLARYPLGFGQWLVALDQALALHREIAIVGRDGSEDTRALLDASRPGYRPNETIAMGLPNSDGVPLLDGRTMLAGVAAAYVCQGFTCSAPVTDPAALRAMLEA
jgi:uncharacterized protein YyaL (SSP411 family)